MEQGKILNIGVCNRYHKSVELIEEMNRKGELGNVYHVVCSFRAFRSIPGLGGAFTDKKQSGGGVLIDWGIHYLDLILYILGAPKLKTLTCDAYCEMAKDMKAYKYNGMWAEDTKDVENGVNDVDDLISGYVRTDKASISFNGAWAQNIGIGEMYVDFLGTKAGVRLNYGGDFTLFGAKDGKLTTEKPEFPEVAMFDNEIASFVRCIRTGEKLPSHIDTVIVTAKIMQALYDSSEQGHEIVF